MSRTLSTACGLGLVLVLANGAAPHRPAPADFKLKLTLYEAGDTPLETSELLAHAGSVYRFREHSNEVMIVLPGDERVDIVDMTVNKRAQTSVSFKLLDDELGKLRAAISGAIGKLEKEGGRANRLKAQMTRDLIEPKLTATFDASTNHLNLKGETAEVSATGEPDPDAARLTLIGTVLPVLLKLESLRDPALIPPFAELETISVLINERHLRPTEVSMLFRLAGPPRRVRWTYELVPSLTERELEALARVDLLRRNVPSLGFSRYEGRTAR
jgi:hypothetical protein